MNYDAIVIGGSFAGLSAATYIARARRRVLVIDAGSPRNRFAAAAHGFLGQDGVAPADILATARAQLSAYPTVEFHSGRAVSAQKTAAGFSVETDSGRTVEAAKLVIASGRSDILPEIPGLKDRWGQSVLHCPYCHGYEIGGGQIGVLASHPMSVHQAELVSDWGPATFFTNGLDILTDEARRLLAARNITIETAPVAALEGNGTALSAVRLNDGRIHDISALFIGAETRFNSPIAEQLGCAIEDSPMGRFITTDDRRQTTILGVYAAGDVARPQHAVSLAVADGMVAGVSLHQSLVSPTLA
ncbi:NAD(P)/FAD-dependent oxidoreductase [Asticcacaulis sp. SL142]|uniref:NAD(P)/FAD-dependent oxidoreductase n=1 Tax=Asticcacaulis sp. SL142 TaxID=2995155 RepID=UPI00226CF01B|nr:NAD(P)/FAD-dependent oxidoreductase [Asticcacaulis sp. SL142]WAC46918.1 NAD(P)/FAD-dependent oxidoreductase [Asticcacaulis sp. SL142]